MPTPVGIAQLRDREEATHNRFDRYYFQVHVVVVVYTSTGYRSLNLPVMAKKCKKFSLIISI